MDLLVSVVDAVEAQAAVAGGATIVDVKNPAEGPLGAAATMPLHAVAAALPPHVPLSAALGDAVPQAGLVALAAYGAAALGARFVKLALATPDLAGAVTLLRLVRESAALAKPACELIAVAYVDALPGSGFDWRLLPQAAQAAGASGCLLDTMIKDGRTLFDHCAEDQLAAWVASCRRLGLSSALAGSLHRNDMRAIRRLGPDVVGVRSAACNGDRVRGRVQQELVARLAAALS